MEESNLNKVLSDSIDYNSKFVQKLSDIGSQFSSQKCFDMFGVINNFPAYIESKLIKDSISSFNFNKIEDHQIINLTNISNALKLSNTKNYSCICLGLWASRSYYYALFFTIDFINNLRNNGKNSILKKELEAYIEQGKYLSIETRIIDDKKVKIFDLSKLDQILIDIQK